MKPCILVASLLQSCAAQTISTSWTCEAGSDVTSFPACNDFLNSGNACATVLERPGKQECLCNQEYLDSLYKCENELQLCFLGNQFEGTFDRGIELWESLCGSYVTFSPTTPSAKPYTEYPEELCIDVEKACQTARNLLSDCLPYTSDIETSRLSSCECQPRLLRLAYTCQYIGNTSCLATEAATSNAWGYATCDNFASVIGKEHSAQDKPTLTEVNDLPTLSAKTRATVTISAAQTSTKSSSSSQSVPDMYLMLSVMTFIGVLAKV
ncbi:hypothetical protein QL093DRAFT_2256263 [Fusarium oxysporum]|nr:hypothetical protein QL093DRAFT_2256263 [Fusarium oxysporum]